VPSSVDYSRLYWLAVFLIAAREPAIVWPLPMLIEVVMDLRVLRRVMMVLRERWRRHNARKYDRESSRHPKAPLVIKP
jgi:hypothetical protein